MENNNNLSGFLLINKPSGPTSHDVVDRLRQITGIKKIGHAGTLDPFATGLLVCAVGRAATKTIEKFVKLDKEYLATLHLGATTDTYDRTGQIIKKYQGKKIEESLIKKTLLEFSGKQAQTPPMFSAKKINGKKLYELARAGVTVERQPVPVEIFSLEILSYVWPELKLKINCSSGTYIRSLANDLGERLGSGAYLMQLQRTKIGEFNLREAAGLAELNAGNWQTFLLLD